MVLGMEVGLSPGDFVLDGDPAPPPKGGGPPNFRPMSITGLRDVKNAPARADRKDGPYIRIVRIGV